MDSYLSDRTIKLNYASHVVCRQTNKGCVQGSVGGPLLWNLLLDPLLKTLHEAEITAQAFADDIVLLVEGNIASDIEVKPNSALAMVN
ncbi:unnamed protein product [Pieris macdunnoughi]|uniref:Reverse transcriptase domain-containing protein n=1 Tax=Pieris macdunnoughi TaxID=345717 RepID=A0A821QUB1_9NEOP|nr:unnamed protein product [Pieris macdunnoughi]